MTTLATTLTRLTDKAFVERASVILLLASPLAVCVLGALYYDIAPWFGAS